MPREQDPNLSVHKALVSEQLTMTEELRREPTGVVGRELRDELALSSSELRLSEPSLKPLLMELLSSQLHTHREEIQTLRRNQERLNHAR